MHEEAWSNEENLRALNCMRVLVGWLVLTPDFYAYIFSEMNEFYEAAGANNLQSARIPYIEFRVGFRTNEGVSNA